MIPKDEALRIVQGVGTENDSLTVTKWMKEVWGSNMTPEKAAFWIQYWVNDNVDKRDQLQRWRAR